MPEGDAALKARAKFTTRRNGSRSLPKTGSRIFRPSRASVSSKTALITAFRSPRTLAPLSANAAATRATFGTGRVADLREALGEQVPQLRPILANLLVAVGTDYATDATPLDPTAEIACFPPVSGG